MIEEWLDGPEPEPDTYNEDSDRVAYYVLCAYHHRVKDGPIPRGLLDSWQNELEQLTPRIRLHETARPLYYTTPFSEIVIGRLIDVPPMWISQAFEPWRTAAKCGHITQVATRRGVKYPPAKCLACQGKCEQPALFKAPLPHIGWIEYHARFKRADWQMFRRRKLNDQPFCIICRAEDHLDVHHNTYVRFGRERLEDLVVLCRACHETHHEHARFRWGVSDQ